MLKFIVPSSDQINQHKGIWVALHPKPYESITASWLHL
ncbi:hypothetical protein Niako_1761 [Niastella koreensis GR20-10]|uniref:Uncharacterized protein n=1 Tax=Niastella koreensis (strain DSM 17620 / KACC 11465 / NBRC 106392 / GR20-10) TaxID=700598 RepID=G8TAG2_NIAKG|nr:hypothetical protein Niako_1761 [Niastella koreensis GR20-10]